MVFLAHLAVNLHVCLCGDCRSPPRKRLISLVLAKNPHFRMENRVLPEIIGQTGTRPAGVGLSTRSVWGKILISGLETGFYREIISGWRFFRIPTAQE